jgi:hypothetical protein
LEKGEGQRPRRTAVPVGGGAGRRERGGPFFTRYENIVQSLQVREGRTVFRKKAAPALSLGAVTAGVIDGEASV